jgi:hypothetical protein
MGRMETGLAEMKRAHELDPFESPTLLYRAEDGTFGAKIILL